MANFNELINGEIPVLVDFFATWCGPCQMMHPVLENLKKELGDKLHVLKIDIDNGANRSLVEQHQVQSVPTLILFKSGKVVWKQSGAMALDPLKGVIGKYI